MSGYFVADVGGTNIRVATVTADGDGLHAMQAV